ncbi:uncharacterized protein [Procambarus clarkii]|uniref:uncharacterized protein isoform X2 n=2 Tax=Procambarus clarkii TaxID=6728 RepID=UPI003742FA31
MSWSRLRGGIQAEDHNIFRVYKAHVCEARLVLYNILRWGCRKSPTQSFEEYLIHDVGLLQGVYNRKFTKTQKEKIRSSPTGDKFDITLLFKMIQVACHSLAPENDDTWHIKDFTRLEYLLTCIKNSRNDLAHSESFTSKSEMVQGIETLRNLLIKTMRVGAYLYCVDLAEVGNLISEMNRNLNNIRDQFFTPEDINQYRHALLFDSLRDILCVEGVKELKKIYGKKVFVNPFSLIDNSEWHLQVNTVFVCLHIKHSKANKKHSQVNYEDLLEYNNSPEGEQPDNGSDRVISEGNAQLPSMLLLEGCVGSGKTTLLKLAISEWIAGTGSIKGLSEYDLVLHLECHDSYTDSLTKLLLSDMPKTASKIRKNDLLHICLSLKILVLIDGLDELNQSSEKLFREILHVMNSANITLICTTRPEKIKDIQKIASQNVKIVHWIIQGIPSEKRHDFVGLYHEELKQRGLSHQETDHLIQYVRQAPPHLHDFFRYPLNLVLLAAFWARAHERISQVTSTTSLYIETHNLLKEKLYERLKHRSTTQHLNLTQMQDKCEQFLSVMYQEALVSLGRDAVHLDSKTTHKLKDVCSKIGLPSDEVFSAFFTFILIKTSSGYTSELSFQHKGVQDFYAAKCVTALITDKPFPEEGCFLNKLNDFLQRMKVPDYYGQQITKCSTELDKKRTIRSVLEELNRVDHTPLDISKYRNVLYNLAGLVKIQGPDAMERYAPEIVELLKESADTPFEYLVDMLKEADHDINLAREISKYIPKFCWTVTDGQVQAAARLLRYNCPTRLIIDIVGDPNQVVQLESLLEAVSRCNCSVQLYLHHHWRHPQAGLSDSFIHVLANGRRMAITSTKYNPAGSQNDMDTHRSRDDLKPAGSGHGSQDELRTSPPLGSGHLLQDDLHSLTPVGSGHGSQDDLHWLNPVGSGHSSQDDQHAPTSDASGHESQDDQLAATSAGSGHGSQDDQHAPTSAGSGHGSNNDINTLYHATASTAWSQADLQALHTYSMDDLVTSQNPIQGQRPLQIRSRLTEVMGHLGVLAAENLPSTIRELHLSLADDHQISSWSKMIPTLTTRFPDFRHIWIHLVVGISTKLLPKLPRLRYRPHLYLSGVGDGDIEWACKSARALLPAESKFASICLARSEITEHGMEELVHGLQHLKVGVYKGKGGGLLVASPALNSDTHIRISSLVLSKLNCLFFEVDNEEIWYDESAYERCYEYDKLMLNKLLAPSQLCINDPTRASGIQDHQCSAEYIYARQLRHTHSGKQRMTSKMDSVYEVIEELPSLFPKKASYCNYITKELNGQAPRPPKPLPRPPNTTGAQHYQSYNAWNAGNPHQTSRQSLKECKHERNECRKDLVHSHDNACIPHTCIGKKNLCYTSDIPLSINICFGSSAARNCRHCVDRDKCGSREDRCGHHCHFSRCHDHHSSRTNCNAPRSDNAHITGTPKPEYYFPRPKHHVHRKRCPSPTHNSRSCTVL